MQSLIGLNPSTSDFHTPNLQAKIELKCISNSGGTNKIRGKDLKLGLEDSKHNKPSSYPRFRGRPLTAVTIGGWKMRHEGTID
jgi:hypothetical protein